MSFHAIARPSGQHVLEAQMEEGEWPSDKFVKEHSEMSKAELEGEYMQWRLEGEKAVKSSFPVCTVEKKDFDLDTFLSNPVFEEQEKKEDSGFQIRDIFDKENASEELQKLL